MLIPKKLALWSFILWMVCTVLSYQRVQASQLVGETANISISTTHPYTSGWDGQIVASWTVSRPNASFIKVHFTNFDLNAGDYVEIRDTEGILRQTITHDNRGKTDFWAFAVDGSAAIIELFSGSKGQEAYGFDIDKYGYGTIPFRIESICGSDDKVNIECVNGTNQFERAKSVGQMKYQFGTDWYVCTGFLVSDEGHFLSNEHCVNNQSILDTLEVRFNYQYTTCNGSTFAKWDSFYGDTFLIANTNYDLALMKLAGNPQNTYGYLDLDPRDLTRNETVYIPQHPGGDPKKYDSGPVSEPVANGYAIDSDFGHLVDTEGGSSGSPVLSFSEHKVVGLHHLGGCDSLGQNKAVLMKEVYPVIESYLPSMSPGPAELNSPSDAICDYTPTYTWNAVPNSTWYYLWVNDSSGKLFATWYTAKQTNCASGTGQCSVTPDHALEDGSHKWWIQTWNSSGYGPWSSGMTFDVGSVCLPAKATLVSPGDYISDNIPTYTWNAVPNSTWYYLWVNDSSGKLFATWYTAKQTNCASGTGQCSVTPDHALEDGSHKWWIQTWNSSGYGPWSDDMEFTLGIPDKAKLISPSDSISDNTPTYGWNAVSGATWYYLWVNDSSGKLFATWYTAKQTNCASGTGQCSVTPDRALEDGSHKWWIQTWNSNGYGPWSSGMTFDVEKNGGPNCQFSGSDCGWEFHAGGSWSVVNSSYYYTEGVAGSGSSASYPANYTDFDYKTKIKRAGSNRLNSNRIIVRGTPDPQWGANNWYKGYVLQYTTDGRFSLMQWDSGTTSILYPWTDSDYLALGAAWNFFRIVARGSTIEFYINGIRHVKLINANLTSGRVGIEMNRDDSSTGNGFWVDYVTLSTEVGSDLNADDEIVFEDHHIFSDTDILHQTILSEEGESQTP